MSNMHSRTVTCISITCITNFREYCCYCYLLLLLLSIVVIAIYNDCYLTMSIEVFTSVALITLVCVAVSYIILNHRRRLSFIKAIDVIPGPRSLPLIGNLYLFPSFLLRKNLDGNNNMHKS